MNLRGSYRRLQGNSKAAMIAAIEIYNKPSFSYRDECFVILLLNAWELFTKSMLSKNGRSIYYPKKRHQPYRTLALTDALQRSGEYFPTSVSHLAVSENVLLLNTFRDNAIHFYNRTGFSELIYTLAQTSIVNYKDLLQEVFGIDLSREVTIQILPLGLTPPVDPISFLQNPSAAQRKASPAVSQFIDEIRHSLKILEDQGEDTARLLTIFNVKFESTKKIGQADIVVGVDSDVDRERPLIVERRVDPNVSHPMRQKDVVETIGSLDGVPFTPYVNQAIVWKYDVRENLRYCWHSAVVGLTTYSRDYLTFLKSLTAQQITSALGGYREYLRTMSSSR